MISLFVFSYNIWGLLAFIILQTNSERVTNLCIIALPVCIPESISDEKQKMEMHFGLFIWMPLFQKMNVLCSSYNSYRAYFLVKSFSFKLQQ